MVSTDHSEIKQLFEIYNKVPQLAELKQRFNRLPGDIDSNTLIALYQQAIPVIERELWANDVEAQQLELYQGMFRQMEQIYAACKDDQRHSFIVVIPVADRPQHLSSCLGSLLSLCEKFKYGGFNNQAYDKIQVVIADDSKDEDNMQAHRKIAEQVTAKGLRTIYFGQAEQIEQVSQITEQGQQKLTQIIGDMDASAFYHKGASIMRNITYLKLNQMSKGKEERLLFYFIDSDQEFRVKAQSMQGEQDVYAINYFYHLDQIFSNDDIRVLTGKVVGDPPVSPAVMAGNFLDDVTGFLQQISRMDAQESCQFHQPGRNKVTNASYHDMADLFGFKTTTAAYQYHCTIDV
ncbi:MAG: hypothetical protein OQL09_05945, partial [Gammaproteobacteria bacterium]|nr:hypothetical protein [Gammaproteobacteria bacterium]